MNSNGNTPTAVDWMAKLPWLSIEEAAEISKYHPEHIRRLCRKGRIKAEKKSKHDWWIDRAALEAYLLNPPPRGRPKSTSSNEKD
jgi:excisionase family DNA binding protein